MNILVCVKQVPGSSNVEVDPVTGVLKRNGIQSKINPYDLYAIESALTLAERYGGSVDYDWHMSTGPVFNDPEITEQIRRISEAAGLKTCAMPRRMSSEDFGWYLEKAPGALFRFGTRNESLGCNTLAHRSDFCIDESGMRAAIHAFVALAYNYERR